MTKRLRESDNYTYLGKNDNHEEHHPPLPLFIKKNELFSIWKLLVWIPINSVKGMLQEYLGSDKDVCINIILLFIFFEERLHTAFHFITGGINSNRGNRGNVFGGFVRDLISGNVFSDVDILFNTEQSMHKFTKLFNSKYDTVYELKNQKNHNIKTKYMSRINNVYSDDDGPIFSSSDDDGTGPLIEKEYTLLSRISGCFVKNKSEINNFGKIEVKFDLILLKDKESLMYPHFCRDFSCNGLMLTNVGAIEKHDKILQNIFELSNPDAKKRRLNGNNNNNNDYFPFHYDLAVNPICCNSLRIHEHLRLCKQKKFLVYNNNGTLSSYNHHWKTYGEQCIESNTDYGKHLLERLKSMKRKGFICEQRCENIHCILYNLNK
jgi:predicted nucleotidyltransferase